MKLFTRIAHLYQSVGRLIAKTFDLRDGFVFTGLGFIAFGVWQIYTPAAYIVIGLGLFLLGVRR